MKHPKIPDWLEGMPGTMNIGTREIAAAYGVDESYVWKLVQLGKFPKHEFEVTQHCGIVRHKKFYWRLSTLRRQIKADAVLVGG